VLSDGGARSFSRDIILGLSYKLDLSRPGEKPLSRIVKAGTEPVSFLVSPGEWTIRAEAYTGAGVLYGIGETTLTVAVNKLNEAEIDMSFSPAWHVAQGGNDETGTGSGAAPFATVNKALEAIGEAYEAGWWPDGSIQDVPVPARIIINGTITGGGAENGMVEIREKDGFMYTSYLPIILAGGTGGGTLRASGGKRVLYMDNADVTLAGELTLTGGKENMGGGVYITGSSRFTMTGNAVIEGNEVQGTSDGGGGVYVANGTFTMEGGTIKGNKTTGTASDGGGVYVANGTFTMNGGAISDNHAATALTGDGGGVYVAGGTFTMTGGSIGGNTASGLTTTNGGGGVYIDSGTFTMEGGTIKGNEVDGTAGTGGGVHIDDALFTMTGGSINGNRASGGLSTGGGVYVAGDGTFRKTGGIIYGGDAEETLKNTAGSGGHAAYVFALLSPKKRNATAGRDTGLDSGISGAAGGWE
jgi:hypothetical protein